MITKANLVVIEQLVHGEQFPNSPRVIDSFGILSGEIKAMEKEIVYLREVHRTVNDFRALMQEGMGLKYKQ